MIFENVSRPFKFHKNLIIVMGTLLEHLGIFVVRDEVTGERRKLHNEELKGLYSSPSIVRVINSRRMRWVGHVARMGEGRGV